jgi:hypothetical protein
MVATNSLTDLDVPLVSLGRAAENEPLYGGTLIFLIVGASLLYLTYVRTEMDVGRLVKVIGFAMIGLAVLAAFWPMRPWPH